MSDNEFLAMLNEEFNRRANIPEKPDFELFPGQQKVFEHFKEFVRSKSANTFLLKGYAGTGKTSLIRHFIYWLHENHFKFTLLASTGRGAKILSDITAVRSFTIHSLIYMYEGLNQELDKLTDMVHQHQLPGTQLMLNFALRSSPDEDMIYIIDEASMISDVRDPSSSFARYGSGNVLRDLFTYHPQGKFVFSGDSCQLPPVNQKFSPALDKNYLNRTYHRITWEAELNEVIRQSARSGILDAATKIRRFVLEPPSVPWPRIVPLRNRNNIIIYPEYQDFVEKYIYLIAEYGYQRATLICYSNKYCSVFNELIRKFLFDTNEPLIPGDLLMVVQNNYLVDLVNGDLVEVLKVGNYYERANLRFREVEVRELGSQRKFNTLLIESVLTSLQQRLDEHQHLSLFIDFNIRMRKKEIKQGTDKFDEAMKSDPYLNALRANYGYALTCHKSQGGEWDDVFVFIDNKTLGLQPPGFYQWLYTAVTRARKHLHVPDGWFLS